MISKCSSEGIQASNRPECSRITLPKTCYFTPPPCAPIFKMLNLFNPTVCALMSSPLLKTYYLASTGARAIVKTASHKCIHRARHRVYRLSNSVRNCHARTPSGAPGTLTLSHISSSTIIPCDRNSSPNFLQKCPKAVNKEPSSTLLVKIPHLHFHIMLFTAATTLK